MKNAKMAWYAKGFFIVKYKKKNPLSIWYLSVVLLWLPLLESKIATPSEISKLLQPLFLYENGKDPGSLQCSLC